MRELGSVRMFGHMKLVRRHSDRCSCHPTKGERIALALIALAVELLRLWA
jgi:hypothetical protein